MATEQLGMEGWKTRECIIGEAARRLLEVLLVARRRGIDTARHAQARREHVSVCAVHASDACAIANGAVAAIERCLAAVHACCDRRALLGRRAVWRADERRPYRGTASQHHQAGGCWGHGSGTRLQREQRQPKRPPRGGGAGRRGPGRCAAARCSLNEVYCRSSNEHTRRTLQRSDDRPQQASMGGATTVDQNVSNAYIQQARPPNSYTLTPDLVMEIIYSSGQASQEHSAAGCNRRRSGWQSAKGSSEETFSGVPQDTQQDLHMRIL